MTTSFLSDNLVGIILFFLRLGLTLTLIAFFGLAVRSIWQDLRKHTESTVAKSTPLLSFNFGTGSAPQTFSLNEISIGRDPSSDLVIADESVSARHARCYYRKSQWWFEDTMSSNGSKLNRTEVNTPTVLTSGDQITVGGVSLTISFSN